MSYYARINILSKKVDKIISAEENYIKTLPDYDLWLKTSYNTFGGKHTLDGEPLRKNYAAVGFTYDILRDAFIPPKPYASWILDEETCLWEAPTPYPTDNNKYIWNEETLSWNILE